MGSDNFAHLWVQSNLNAIATNRALQAIQARGASLPCQVTVVTGSLVTVKFLVTIPFTNPATGETSSYSLSPVQMPKAESEWIRMPTQVGDYGMTVPADTFLGGISGIGNGIADLSIDYGNLTTLVFVPVGSTAFQASPDGNKAWIYGPSGAILSDKAQTANVTVAANLVTIAASSGTVQIQGSGTASTAAIMRAADVQSALVAFKTAMVTAGISGAGGIVVPTVAGSTKAFSG